MIATKPFNGRHLARMAACALAFGAAAPATAITFLFTGDIVTYTVPVAGIYSLVAMGANGNGAVHYERGNSFLKQGGLGIELGGAIRLAEGAELRFLVGGGGGLEHFLDGKIVYGGSSGGGGGGGSFVVGRDGAPLLIAGGGGGAGSRYNGGNASAGTAGGVPNGGLGGSPGVNGGNGLKGSNSAGSIGGGGGGGFGSTGYRGKPNGNSFASGGGGGAGTFLGDYSPAGGIVCGNPCTAPNGIGGDGGFGGGGGGGGTSFVFRGQGGAGGGYSGGGGGNAGSGAGGGGGGSYRAAGFFDWLPPLLNSGGNGGNGSITLNLITADPIGPGVDVLPEPDAWLFYVTGFGLMGAILRRTRPRRALLQKLRGAERGRCADRFQAV